VSDLPIEHIKSDFLSAIKRRQRLIVLSAAPGAGKSTILPLWLLAENSPTVGKIYLLQPRRIAAKSIATYLAQQLGEPVGKTVGYRLRNETNVSKQTRLEVITEGVLTQIIQQDPELTGCDLILFDEFHLRSATGDFAFALARDCQQELRDDLTLVLMSATLDNTSLKQQLPEAVFLSCEGRTYPITIDYKPVPSTVSWRDHLVQVVIQQIKQSQASMLVFLPGVADIRYCLQKLMPYATENLHIHGLYGNLTLQDQHKILSPCEKEQRKIVLATNIAETSLTIDGIAVVIDSGLEKRAIFHPVKQMNQLQQQNISQASAIQRAGRAGRMMAGYCIRLYSQSQFERLAKQAPLAITQTDLAPILLQASQWGVNLLSQLPWLQVPPEHAEQLGWQWLQQFQLVDQQHRLTPYGQQVVSLSCHPRLGHMLYQAKQLAVEEANDRIISLACLLAALLEDSARHVNRQSVDIAQQMLELVRQYSTTKSSLIQQANRLAQQCNHRISTNELPFDYLGILLAYAYPEFIGQQRDNEQHYILANGRGAFIYAMESLCHSRYVVVADAMQSKQGLQIKLAAALDETQIYRYLSALINTKTHLDYNVKTEKITAINEQRIGRIVLKQQRETPQLDARATAQLWGKVIKQQGLSFLSLGEDCLWLLSRWRWLYHHFTEQFPVSADEDELINTLDDWLLPYIGDKQDKKSLNTIDFKSLLLARLNYLQQQQLEQAAPEIYQAPNGVRYRFEYSGQGVKLSLPMQAVYGITDTPKVGFSYQPITVVIEFLSPAGRPIQLTQDIGQFWQGSYKAVQKEMKARYPKHYWPDDPANAIATTKTKRQLQ
jgi:ATP-dependent helicase HrpB